MSRASYEIPDKYRVEGIRDIEQHAVANQSHLLKPNEFNGDTFVGKWSFVGASAERAQLPQRLLGKYAIDGWSVWKFPKGAKDGDGNDIGGKPCMRPLGNKQAILLFRPKTLQSAVNGIYGNISRDRTIDEQQGRTVEGKPVTAGILPEDRLRRYDPTAEEAVAPIGYTFNDIAAAKRPKSVKQTNVKTRKT